MKPVDYIGDCCECPECSQAGVSEKPIRRDPRSGAWMHGQALRRWYEAYENFQRLARTAVGGTGRHAAGFEPLVKKGTE